MLRPVFSVIHSPLAALELSVDVGPWAGVAIIAFWLRSISKPAGSSLSETWHTELYICLKYHLLRGVRISPGQLNSGMRACLSWLNQLGNLQGEHLPSAISQVNIFGLNAFYLIVDNRNLLRKVLAGISHLV